MTYSPILQRYHREQELLILIASMAISALLLTALLSLVNTVLTVTSLTNNERRFPSFDIRSGLPNIERTQDFE